MAIRQSGNVLGGWVAPAGGFKGTTKLPLEKWLHLAVTWDRNTALLYIDGEIDAESPAPGLMGPRPNDDPVWIGASSSAKDPETPDGMMDEIRLSDVVRTQDEIKASMEGLQLAVESLEKLATTWGSLKRDL
jgi:hypothetical protein